MKFWEDPWANVPLFKGLVKQFGSPGTILDMTLIQGKQENTYDGIQLIKKKLPVSLELWKTGVGHTGLKCFSWGDYMFS